MPPLAVRVVVAPEQIPVVPAMVAVGLLAAETDLNDEAVQPAASVTVTVNVPAAPTGFAATATLLLQAYDVPPVAVKVVVKEGQKVVVPAMLAVGFAKAVTTTVEVATQPTAFVTDTV